MTETADKNYFMAVFVMLFRLLVIGLQIAEQARKDCCLPTGFEIGLYVHYPAADCPAVQQAYINLQIQSSVGKGIQ